MEPAPDDCALSLWEWRDFFEECESFDVIRPQRQRPRGFYIIMLCDALEPFDSDFWDAAVPFPQKDFKARIR
jgi:hypothetical protein